MIQSTIAETGEQVDMSMGKVYTAHCGSFYNNDHLIAIYIIILQEFMKWKALLPIFIKKCYALQLNKLRFNIDRILVYFWGNLF